MRVTVASQVLTGADESMYPGSAKGVVAAMEKMLIADFNIPAEVPEPTGVGVLCQLAHARR